MCISQLAVAIIKRGRLLDVWDVVQGIRDSREDVSILARPLIYSVDVPLHLWERDEKIPLFFSHNHPPYPECTPPLPFLLSFSPHLACHVDPLDRQWVSQG